MRESPTIASASLGSASTTMGLAQFSGAGIGIGTINQLNQQHFGQKEIEALLDVHRSPMQITHPQQKEIIMAASPRRIVQVFIVDPNENVSLEDCLLYKGDPKMTDLTDQELFFELDIKDILTKHNEKRIKVVNKAVKDRVELLEPARVRDLKMTVVSIATF